MIIKSKLYSIALLANLIFGALTVITIVDYFKTRTEVYKLARKFEMQKTHSTVKSILNKKLIHIIVASILFATSVVILASIMLKAGLVSAWIISSFFALFAGIGIASIWIIAVTGAQTKSRENIIEDQKDVDEFLAFYKQYYSLTNAHFLPVGFVIFALEIDQNVVSLFNYSWIKYHVQKDTDITGEFYVSNAKKEEHINPATKTSGDWRVTGWQSNIVIHEKFDYAKYPFDLQQITLVLNHAQWTGNNVLVPDFRAYRKATVKFPTLDPNLSINRWNVINAYFFYTFSNWQSDFGIEDFEHQKDYPYLSFNIEIQRDFFTPLVTTLLPIIIILFTVFGSIIIFPHVQNKKAGVQSILSLLAGMFFSNIVAHQTFERAVNTSAITYFACFYYIVYAIIFLVSINCMLFAYFENIRFIHYKNNLLPKLFYWPVTMLTFFVVTLYFFY